MNKKNFNFDTMTLIVKSFKIEVHSNWRTFELEPSLSSKHLMNIILSLIQ